MNTNLDDVENLLRNLVLSLGHASEILPPRLSLVKAENASRAEQFEHLLQATNIEPIVLASIDAELFGHWWYEGPMFLNFFRKAVYDQKVFELTTPSAYLEKHDTLQILFPAPRVGVTLEQIQLLRTRTALHDRIRYRSRALFTMAANDAS